MQEQPTLKKIEARLEQIFAQANSEPELHDRLYLHVQALYQVLQLPYDPAKLMAEIRRDLADYRLTATAQDRQRIIQQWARALLSLINWAGTGRPA